jgi:hypothetical protein
MGRTKKTDYRLETDFTDYEEAAWSPDYMVNSKKGLIITAKENRFIGSHPNGNSVYSQARVGELLYTHQLIFLHCYGSLTPGLVIDHIDGNKKNNSISNLEEVTQSENCKRAAEGRDFSHMKSKQGPKAVYAVPMDDGPNINIVDCQKFHSVYQCGKEIGVNCGIISQCCDKKNYVKSGTSKIDGKRYHFIWGSVLDAIFDDIQQGVN